MIKNQIQPRTAPRQHFQLCLPASAMGQPAPVTPSTYWPWRPASMTQQMQHCAQVNDIIIVFFIFFVKGDVKKRGSFVWYLPQSRRTLPPLSVGQTTTTFCWVFFCVEYPDIKKWLIIENFSYNFAKIINCLCKKSAIYKHTYIPR